MGAQRLKREGVVGRLLREAFLLDLLLDAVSLHGRQAVDEEDAVQVVHLVLDHAGVQPARRPAPPPSALDSLRARA